MTGKDRIHELDGLRGIAIGLVLIQHYFVVHTFAPAGSLLSRLQTPFRLAWTGVDLFFVLSGFLIGGILLDAKESSNYFPVFYRRRFFRIIPLYAVCVLFAFGLSIVAGHQRFERLRWMSESRLPWISYVLFLQNFLMAHRNTIGVFALAVTWSLAVEEQFYLTLPLLVRFLNKRLLLVTLVGGIAAAPILRVLLYLKWPNHVYAWYQLMPCRADSLLFGVLAAYALRTETWRTWLTQQRRLFHFFVFPALILGIAILNHKAAGIGAFPMLSLGYSWIAVFYVSLLLYALLWRQSWISGVLRWTWLGALGTIAYGAYLLHETVLGLFYSAIWSKAPVASSAREFAVTGLALITTLILCQISWKYFEKPLVKVGHLTDYAFASTSKGMSENPRAADGN